MSLSTTLFNSDVVFAFGNEKYTIFSGETIEDIAIVCDSSFYEDVLIDLIVVPY